MHNLGDVDDSGTDLVVVVVAAAAGGGETALVGAGADAGFDTA